MSFPYQFIMQSFDDIHRPYLFFLHLPKRMESAGAMIDGVDRVGFSYFLNGTLREPLNLRDSTLEVVSKDGKELIRVATRYEMEKKYEYISPQDLQELQEMHEREQGELDEDPVTYMAKAKQKSGMPHESIYFQRYLEHPEYSDPSVISRTKIIVPKWQPRFEITNDKRLIMKVNKDYPLSLNLLKTHAARRNIWLYLDGVLGSTYTTEGYAAKVVEKEGKKMLKVFFRLMNENEPGCPAPGYITPKAFKELLEIWIREREKFEKDPGAYKQEMIRNGAIIVHPEDRAKDPEAYEKKIREAKHGVIEESRPSRWKFWKKS